MKAIEQLEARMAALREELAKAEAERDRLKAQKHGRGRPPTGKPRRRPVKVYLTPECHAEASRLAKVAEGGSLSELLAALLEGEVARVGAAFDAAFGKPR